MPKAVIIGASSGIGRALASELSEQGYEIGLAARRIPLLLELQKELRTKSYIKQIDVTDTSQAIKDLQSLIQEMGNVDVIVVNAGVFLNNPSLKWDSEKATIDVNVLGFTAMAHTAMMYFVARGAGQLVGISSISALRGETASPAYSASKAFVSNYLEGLRCKAFKANRNIVITDIQPGWVDTIMAAGEKTFWMASAKEAAQQIYSTIKHKRQHAYVTPRWRLYAWYLKLMPRWLYDRLFS